jgi:beta-lactamase regulating signal transducer with metallopeptidase domain/tetratricopeptide (TPR) repeat protein
MNSFIETLNVWGQHALRFAWPMLWQSSLLILLLFALDFILRRKVRAAVRYALWCLVLVKLLLPPSLALPTSVAWWLRQPTAPAPAPVPTQQPATVVVTYPNTDAAALPSPRTIPAAIRPVQPSTPISRAAWALGGWSLISLGLLFWLGVRWRHVTQLHRSSVPTSAQAERSELDALFESAKRLAGVRQSVPCQLIERPMSPAVCGLFRPVILLPRLLADQLPAGQLRAILLHELIHLRRRDVWVNCLQALLQIVFWWHPLLWLANARIRRLREEAVDDAVMLALADQADAYAPTLLEVARLAFYRPLTALGLVGILESRRGLRQRIERLTTFNAPRRAGLSVVSLLLIAAVTALAVPMGQAPPKAAAPTLAAAPNPPTSQTDAQSAKKIDPSFELQADSVTHDQSTGIVQADGHVTMKSPEGTIIRADSVTYDPAHENIRATSNRATGRVAQVMHTSLPGSNGLTTNAMQALLMAAAIQTDFARNVTVLSNDVVILNNERNLFGVADSAEINTQSGQLRANHVRCPDGEGNAMFFEQVDMPIDPRSLQIELLVRGPNSLDYTNAAYQRVIAKVKGLRSPDVKTPRQALYEKLSGIHIQEIKFDHLPLTEAIHILSDEVKKQDADGRGIHFLFRPSTDPASTNPSPEEFDFSAVSVTLTLHDVRAIDVLDGVAHAADRPIKYAFEDYAVILSPKSSNEPPPLFIRRFKIDPSMLAEALMKFDPAARDIQSPTLNPTVSSADSGVALSTNLLIRFFAAAGIDLDPAKGTSIFYKDRSGDLLIRATAEDLDRVEKLLVSMASPAPWKYEKMRSILAELDHATEPPTAAAFVQHGRLLFELGKLDEAETELRSALALEPESKAAQYYLDLVQQARNRPAGQTPQSTPNIRRSYVNPNTSSQQSAPDNSTNLYIRRFKVDPSTFYQGLESAGVLSTSNLVAQPRTNVMNGVTIAVKKFFANFNVNLDLPKSVFFNDREGTLLVRATTQDLDLIEAAIQTLNEMPLQVTLRVKFVEITQDNAMLGFDWFLGNVRMNNSAGVNPSTPGSSATPSGVFPGGGAPSDSAIRSNSAPASPLPGQLTGILTDPQYHAVIEALQHDKKVNLLSDGQVTTLSGRQAQLQVVDMKMIVTNINPQALKPPGIASSKLVDALQTTVLPCGPILDVIPTISPDGYTIHLKVTASLVEFLGYEDAAKTDLVTVYLKDKKAQVPRPMPRIRNRQLSTEAIVWDGQTVVLSGLIAPETPAANGRTAGAGQNPSTKKNLIVFITPALIDQAGNRVHSDDDESMRVIANTIPPPNPR